MPILSILARCRISRVHFKWTFWPAHLSHIFFAERSHLNLPVNPPRRCVCVVNRLAYFAPASDLIAHCYYVLDSYRQCRGPGKSADFAIYASGPAVISAARTVYAGARCASFVYSYHSSCNPTFGAVSVASARRAAVCALPPAVFSKPAASTSKQPVEFADDWKNKICIRCLSCPAARNTMKRHAIKFKNLLPISIFICTFARP